MKCLIKSQLNEKVELEFLNSNDALEAYNAYYKLFDSEIDKKLDIIPLKNSLHIFFSNTQEARNFCIKIKKNLERQSMDSLTIKELENKHRGEFKMR
jgi:hypothetical protein